MHVGRHGEPSPEGSPFVWRLELFGDGSWPFRVGQPFGWNSARWFPKRGCLGDVTYRLVDAQVRGRRSCDPWILWAARICPSFEGPGAQLISPYSHPSRRIEAVSKNMFVVGFFRMSQSSSLRF